MHSRVTISAATQPGGSQPNQDRFHADGQCAFVLDGASAIRPQKRDGGWYAGELSKELGYRLKRNLNSDLRGSLRSAIASVASMLDAGDGSPSSTVTIATWSDAILDVLVLGDSTAVVYLKSGAVEVLYDARLDAIGTELRDAYQDALSGGNGFSTGHRERLRKLQEEQLRTRNQPGGYWIAADDPAAADESLTMSFPLGEVDAVLLATDGAADGVLTYGLMTWQEVRQRITMSGPEAHIEEIVIAEREDADGMRWPRGKRSDDKTVVLIDFGP